MNIHLSDFTTPQVIAIAAIIVIAVVVIAFLIRKTRTARLRKRFGDAEYQHAVTERGDRGRAEALLEQREKRVGSFHLRALTPGDRRRFEETWGAVQAHFVDAPAGAVTEADELLAEVMAARGYPVSDFETRAGDISVDHPAVTQNYRSAHEIAIRHVNGQATTEDLRRAMIHYRALFDELVGETNESERKAVAKEAPIDYDVRHSYKAR